MLEVSPETVLKQLKKNASMRVSSTLDAVYTVCKEQFERGIYDFSFSTISRLGKEKGVPAAQSIRNKSGDAYRTLIKSFADAAANKKVPKPKLSPFGKSAAWIENITDPVLKLQVNILYSQKKEAERLLLEVVPINQVIEIFDNGASPVSKIRLTALEREALEYLLSTEFMRREDLEVGPKGSILRREDLSQVFPVATLDALKKALLHL
ncbi:gamma-mobile-trio protein GmtX [Galbibacter sp.]|uniref:gamma-mobile-trio protein GmtX n=1 Tax=Galbibacter sp. TaxID=2918471 RepID=UPI003A936242